MLNLDTHILVALLNGSLTKSESALLKRDRLAISDIVLWEIVKLIQLGRLVMDVTSPEFRRCLNNLTIIPISLEIARKSVDLDFSSDPADEIIAATSIVEQIPLLTRDRTIRKSKLVPFAML